MIGKNFIYCRAENEHEAVEMYTKFRGVGKSVLYFGGGSEIITMCTAGSIAPDAVIDLKRIPSLNVLQVNSRYAEFGAACTLDAIRTSGVFPLFGETGGRIADHTNQNRITLGGNLCGTIIYREAILPLLLADAELTLFGPCGRRSVSIHDAQINGRIMPSAGEFIVSARVDCKFTAMPYLHIKRVFSEKIGYPAVTAAAIIADGVIRVAFSGICSYPFRSPGIERALNDRSKPRSERIEQAAALLPEPPRTDIEGSGTYRLHIFRIVLDEILSYFEDSLYGSL